MGSSALSPAVVTAINDLELAARLVVEGLRTGGHRSPFHGFTTEFRQHRPYRAGDDLKYLDWKLFARSNRLYTRQFRETTNLPVMLVLDTSASMAFPSGDVSKFRYGQIITAALAYLASEQGHAVGLMTMEDGRLSYVPARGGRIHLRSLLARVDGMSPAGEWNPSLAIARGAQLLQRRGLVIVLSDFYDEDEATRREMRRVSRYGHDVGMIQLLSPAELSFPYEDHVEVEDMETGERRLVDAATDGARYANAVRSFVDGWRANALRDDIEYTLMTTDMTPTAALRAYLLRRARGHTHAGAPGDTGR